MIGHVVENLTTIEYHKDVTFDVSEYKSTTNELSHIEHAPLTCKVDPFI
ncbi:hypothetical protein [Staphylococcus aureus]